VGFRCAVEFITHAPWRKQSWPQKVKKQNPLPVGPKKRGMFAINPDWACNDDAKQDNPSTTVNLDTF
jgi:hypothetical protein